jgi:ketosteroid isomerase-like protein
MIVELYVLDFVGTNVVAAHWDIDLTNRDGKEFQNSGVTVIEIKFGKAFYVKDFLFNTGATWRAGWGVE